MSTQSEREKLMFSGTYIDPYISMIQIQHFEYKNMVYVDDLRRRGCTIISLYRMDTPPPPPAEPPNLNCPAGTEQRQILGIWQCVPVSPPVKPVLAYYYDYMGWRVYHTEDLQTYMAVLIENPVYATELDRAIHEGTLGQWAHGTFHVLHASGTWPGSEKSIKMQIESYGQIVVAFQNAQNFLSDNWMMLLFGAAYAGLLGLSMYQSYNWEP